MKNIVRNLKIASEMIEDKDKIEDISTYQFKKIYPFSNENVKACFEPYQFENKKVLSILASSDQVLEMIYKGASTIDSFDINPLTEDYFYLKKAALLSDISVEELLDYFCYKDYPRTFKENKKAFNIETFHKIKKYLPPKSYQFWETLYQNYLPLNIRKNDRMFQNEEEKSQVLRKTVSYLDENNRKRLKENLKNVNFNFQESDIFKLPKVLTSKYDFMYLSNIIMYHEDSLEDYYTLIKKLANFLNPGGVIIAGYLYEIENYYQKENRSKFFSEKEFEYHYFKPNYDLRWNISTRNHDACLIYKK